MKKSLFIILVILSISCSSNYTKNTEYITSFIGIGISYFPNKGDIVINKIFKNSPVDRLEGIDKIQKFDIIISAKKNTGKFIPLKDLPVDEVKDVLKGKIGDIIYLKLIRKLNDKIIKEWAVTLPVSLVTFEGYDLKEAKYFIQREKDISIFKEWHTKEFYFKKANELGDSYFNIYLNEKPSGIANDAVSLAFKLWITISSYEKINNAVNHLMNDDEILYRISHEFLSAYYITKDKKKISEGRELIHNLIKNVKSLKAKTAFLYELGQDYFYDKDKEKASYYLNEVIKINADKSTVNGSKIILHDIQYLNIGQPAPTFCIKDINNYEICLEKLKGKYVLIHSWSYYPENWKGSYKNIKDIYQKFKKNENFYMIGVASHRNVEWLKKTIIKENFLWPQIIQSFDINDVLFNLYNINSGHQIFLIDPNGIIIYKDIYFGNDTDLIEKISKLIIKK